VWEQMRCHALPDSISDVGGDGTAVSFPICRLSEAELISLLTSEKEPVSGWPGA